ncbi:PLP-dependent aminotransferase family protein [Anaerolentibacter hominis]|uniref:MocR-like pyridoxine biosynthesis transcription factor PdxR n=1 Tax=Anaerolentibacter hominis TaxID=3079009 RepID=UPI0031B86D5D
MITIPLNPGTGIPLYEQIYLFLREEIRAGVYPCRMKLPSTRSLASHLQVSRNTVDLAYAHLLSEGYIEAVPKSGYFVSEVAALLHLQNTGPQPASSAPPAGPAAEIDFSPFSVDLEHFPVSVWRKLAREVLQETDNSLFLQGDNQGDRELRQAIMEYLHQSRGVHCRMEQIIVGAGADYLLQLLVRLFPEGLSVAMEDPAYMQACHIFNGLHIPVVPVPLDASGIRVDCLKKEPCTLTYVTPSHQFPMGVSMSVKRRLELLRFAAETDSYIIEDDHDSEFRYRGKPLSSLQGLDTSGRVIYLGTFSRAVAPAIRVGYMVLPLSLLAVYRERFSYYSCTVSRIDQKILQRFLSDGYFERHINRMRKIYGAKHDAMLHAMKCFGNHVQIQGGHAGLHLTASFSVSLPEKELRKQALNAGIRLYGLNDHRIRPARDTASGVVTLLMGYANLPADKIDEGIRRLYNLMLPWFPIS